MKQYLDIVAKIFTEGEWKENRTGVKALTCANVPFEHDMQEGFPLLTTKKMSLKTIAAELDGFIHGITNKQWYKDRKCNIWNEWANPTLVEQRIQENESPFGGSIDRNSPLAKQFQLEENDLGPIYGYQWVNFNKVYQPSQGGTSTVYNQLADIEKMLKENPHDRRMVCSAWNPCQIDQMALPPCHLAWNVCVINDEINLFWHQRSCDTALGIPYNIASYGILLTLLGHISGLKPRKLSAMFVDCHIYKDHMKGLISQVERDPKPLPQIQLKRNIESVFDWEYTNLNLQNYNSHDKISFNIAI
jgi:thymidylate synthase